MTEFGSGKKTAGFHSKVVVKAPLLDRARGFTIASWSRNRAIVRSKLESPTHKSGEENRRRGGGNAEMKCDRPGYYGMDNSSWEGREVVDKKMQQGMSKSGNGGGDGGRGGKARQQDS